ncbi:phage tail protein [Brucella sp. 2280]|uniref:phage tail protein n=1 Tax=Brucella sp. 2280 TaxID=2592625 RepID=UPI0012964AE1|nr:phage tail protein [Brucella sp. 2280]QGA55847.1 phage tail protein [Brucella sp. 2280]
MPAFTAVAGLAGGLLSSTFLSGALGGALLRIAVGVGLSLAARALNGNKAPEAGGVNGKLQSGGDVARSIILGRTCTAGSLVYANAWGKTGKTPNAYFTQVIALADHPIQALTGLWVNGEPVTIDTSNVNEMGYAVPQYHSEDDDYNLRIKWYDGTQTEADQFLVNRVSSSERPYSKRRIGKGVAYAILTAWVDPELFTGFPTFKFEIQGRKLYDISKDSTAGGSGTHRWSDRSTWGGDGDDLLAVQVYNVLRGIIEQETWLYGLQTATSARLPAADWIAQINKCRSQVQGPDGLEPQFVTGGEVTVDTPIGDAVDKLLTGGNARLIESAGVYKIRVGEPDAPVAFFTDGEILSTEEQTFTPFFGLSETVNGITANYPEPNEGWNTKAAPPLFNATFEVEDGNRRLLTDVPMDYVYRSGQVQRLMKAALNEARRARRHTFVLPPAYWTLEPGDVVSWTSERNGYVNKLMRVDGVTDKANLDVVVDLTEVDPSDYDWDPDTDYTPPVFAPIGTIRPTPQPIVDFSALADVENDDNGNNRRCAILLGWDGDQPDVDLVLFEIRKAWDLGLLYTGRTERVSVGSMRIAPGMLLLPNKSYQIRARYATYAGNRPFEWSDWIPVTMLDIRLGPLDIYPIDIGQLNEDFQKNLEWVGDSFRYVQEELDRIGAQASEQESANYFDKQTLRREMSVTAEGLKASYTEAIEVAIGPGSAIVTRIESLEAVVNDPVTGLEATASAVDLLQVQVNDPGTGLAATANAVTGLTATVSNFSASGLFRTTVEATPSGALARIGLSVSATDGGSTSQAAIFLDAMTGGQSRVVINADQFIVTNGTNSQAPLTFIGGGLALQVANIGDVTAGILRSPDNQVVFNLANKTLIFSDNT